MGLGIYTLSLAPCFAVLYGYGVLLSDIRNKILCRYFVLSAVMVHVLLLRILKT